MTEYQISLSHEIEDRLKLKCDRLADAFVDDIGMFTANFSFINVGNP